MFERYQTKIDRLINAAVNSSGDTSTTLRRKIIDRGKSRITDPHGSIEELPAEWALFVDKMASNSTGITDQDIDVLHNAGHSDDAIIEVMECAALAEGIGRLEVVRAALESE